MGTVTTESPRALVEADRRTDEELLERLLAATYRASVRRPSVLLLRDLAPADADRLLDPVVQARGPGVAGIHYLDEGEEEVFLRAAPAAEIVVAGGSLRERLASRGVPAVGPAKGIRALRRAAGDRTGAGRGVEPEPLTATADNRSITYRTGTG